MIEVEARGADCTVTRDEVITAGSRGVMARFALGSEFDGMETFACFRAEGVRDWVRIAGDGAVCEVPPHLMAFPGDVLEVGLFGARGGRRIATAWATVGTVLHGTGDDRGVTP